MALDLVISMVGAVVVGLSLGVFGSGGSILTVPVLVYLLHHPDKQAIAESLGIVGAIAAIGAIPYALEKLVDWRCVVLFGVPGMIGTVGGAWLAAYVPGFVQLLLFAGVMLLAARSMWRKATKKPVADGTPEAAPASRAVWRVVLDGTIVGVLTGFVGVGGGFLIVPALVLLGGLPMRRAVATSLAIIALKSASGFVKYQSVLDELGQRVDWLTVAVFVLFGAAGSQVGKRLSGNINQNALQKGFAIFLVVMAAFIAVRESVSLLG